MLANPVLRKTADMSYAGPVATHAGTANKTSLLLLLLFIFAVLTWNEPYFTVMMPIFAIATFVLCLLISFFPRTAPLLSIPYACCEGIFLGALSSLIDRSYPGIATQAVLATFGVTMGCMLLYSSGKIRVSGKALRMFSIAVFGLMFIYLAQMVFSFLGFNTLAPLFAAGPVGIVFSLAVVGMAAFSLFIDFQMVEQIVAGGQPKYMEWYLGFSIVVSVVWLYIELLRLIEKIRRS